MKSRAPAALLLRAAGLLLVVAGILVFVFPVLLAGPAGWWPSPGDPLQWFDNLAVALVLAADVPTAGAELSPSAVRLCGALAWMLGELAIAAAARARHLQGMETVRPATAPISTGAE